MIFGKPGQPDLFYFAAIRGYLSGTGLPSSWQALFDARFQPGIDRILFAVAGMNAHINRDLALALNDTSASLNVTPASNGPEHADYQAINQTAGMTPGEWMQPPETATTVRVENGDTIVTDGPFVELKEAVGGYCFFEAPDLDAAIALASRFPAARLGGAIEVRPLMER